MDSKRKTYHEVLASNIAKDDDDDKQKVLGLNSRSRCALKDH